MPPLVSAILPVRDRAAWIARAVDSVLAQSHPAIELIVVDDGSTDGTAAVLDRFGARMVRLRTPGAGAYAARNLGIAHARGDLVAFIDSDDAWHPGHLAALVPRFERAAVGLAFADTVHVTGPVGALRPNGRTSFGVTPPRRGRVAAHFVWGNFVPTTTVVVRRAALAAAGPFAIDPPLGADYAKWIEIAERCDLEHADAPGADYTVHAAGISSDLGRSLAARLAHVSRLEPAAIRARAARARACSSTCRCTWRSRGRAGAPPACRARRPWRGAPRPARGHARCRGLSSSRIITPSHARDAGSEPDDPRRHAEDWAMAEPAVSVIVETITPREHGGHGALVDEITPTLTALLAQPSPAGAVEHLVILDAECAGEADAIARRFPTARLVVAPAANYFAAKNAGVAAARGDVVALIDGDCVPASDWLARLTGALAPGVDVVAGRTRYDGYEGGSLAARTFSVPDFGNVLDAGGGASGFNINNIAYRRETFLAEPLDAAIRRNGGCFLQFHALRRRGARIIYAPDAVVIHGLDVAGLGFAHKHFDRGFDGWLIYRRDDRGLLRGSRWVRRFGPLALVPLQARRIGLDWLRLVRHRRQVGIAAVALPYYGAVMVLTRSIELAGGVAAWLRSAGPVPESRAGDTVARG